MNLATKDSRRYTYVLKLKNNINLKNYNAEFILNRTKGTFYEILEDFVNDNQDEIIKILKPVLKKRETFSKWVILILMTHIVKHFTYEELFPDRTKPFKILRSIVTWPFRSTESIPISKSRQPSFHE